MKANILVVEDESIVAQDLQFTLEDLGYDAFETANCGESAIHKVALHQFDLILMDIRLIGEMDGITTATIIRQRFDIPVVYLTAHADEDTLSRAKITAPYGYLIKPFDREELNTTIEIALYKHQQHQQLKQNAQWLTTVLNSISDGVIATDDRGYITFLNPAAEKLIGCSFKQVLSKPYVEFFKLTSGNVGESLPDYVAETLKTKTQYHLQKNTLLTKNDGKKIYVNGTIAPINSQDLPKIYSSDCQHNPIGTVIIFQDITDKTIAVQNLHRKAFYDSLTNLPNRDWYNERLTDAVERVRRNPKYIFAVLLLDLDRFKTINDTLGHTVGDNLLIATAKRLNSAVRRFDTVSRMGGDEFAILLEDLNSPRESCKVAQRIIDRLASPFIIDGHEINIQCSIGIVLSSDCHLQNDDFIRDADIAMYNAKAEGGCYKIFNTEMRLQIVEANELENELRIAIAEKQLSVYYQPILALPSQEIVGFEALVRWIHPEKGLIFPGKFIPLAEETGLIIEIDLWVLETACYQSKIWSQQGIYPAGSTISVNLSSRHFTKPDCITRIQNILRKTQTSPQKIKLEITETILIETTASTTKMLAELRALGFGLSLDDFGTGYSSLSYLQQFPLDVLKIDRSFVSNVHQNPKNATIAKATIDIAHQLDLTVVAEGVETAAELEFLLDNQCDRVQGYLFSPPLSLSDLKKLKIEKVTW